MKFLETATEKINAVIDWFRRVFAPVGLFLRRFGSAFATVWSFLLKLKKIFLAVPVALAALWLAQRNMELLPQSVGVDLQTDGTFSLLVSREWACGIPVVITLACIVLMCCSRRVLTPWVVSVVSLILPIVLWITNVFPA